MNQFVCFSILTFGILGDCIARIHKQDPLFLQYNGSLEEFISSIYHNTMGCINTNTKFDFFLKHALMNANGKYVVKFGLSHNWSVLRHILFISFGCDVFTNHLHFLKANLSTKSIILNHQ